MIFFMKYFLICVFVVAFFVVMVYNFIFVARYNVLSVVSVHQPN